jgi:hypothetical protein
MWRLFGLLVLAAAMAGCATTDPSWCLYPDEPSKPLQADDPKPPNGAGEGEEKGKQEPTEDKNGKEDKEEAAGANGKPPKTLFDWAIGKKNGNGNGGEEEDVIETDRPDFTEASTTVGRGRIQLESGYTFSHDGGGANRLSASSYPEMLWRIGMFAEWFELRIGQNFFTETETVNGVRQKNSGADDLYLGVKLALAEQKGWLPETAVILQMTVPTGAAAFTANEVQPGINLLYGWDIIKDCVSLGGSSQINRNRGQLGGDFPVIPDDLPGATAGHPFVEIAQSLTVNYTLTRKLGAFTEWFALLPHSATDPEIGPEYYFDGGFTYKVTNNFQLDIRGGVGLNRHAEDFFVGSGFAVRY